MGRLRRRNGFQKGALMPDEGYHGTFSAQPIRWVRTVNAGSQDVVERRLTVEARPNVDNDFVLSNGTKLADRTIQLQIFNHDAHPIPERLERPDVPTGAIGELQFIWESRDLLGSLYVGSNVFEELWTAATRSLENTRLLLEVGPVGFDWDEYHWDVKKTPIIFITNASLQMVNELAGIVQCIARSGDRT